MVAGNAAPVNSCNKLFCYHCWKSAITTRQQSPTWTTTCLYRCSTFYVIKIDNLCAAKSGGKDGYFVVHDFLSLISLHTRTLHYRSLMCIKLLK